jgi:hypothetical protein
LTWFGSTTGLDAPGEVGSGLHQADAEGDDDGGAAGVLLPAR